MTPAEQQIREAMADLADLQAELGGERNRSQMFADLVRGVATVLHGEGYSDTSKLPEEVAALKAELDRLRKGLALVQRHNLTAWNRGHAAGLRAAEEITKQAQEAVKRDAWGNTQLTEALMAAEAERDTLRAENEALKSDAERWRKALSAYERGVIMRSDGKDGYINVFLQAIHEREAAQAAGGRND